ncbi:MAG: HAMP domain-containing sensor histidine kinase [Cyanobacteria bacterium J06632_22]
MKRFKVGLLKETRTRILILYAALMLSAVGLAVPLFRALLFSRVYERVKADLISEMDEFQAVYDDWEQSESPTMGSLTTVTETFVNDYIPEDDNFFIFLRDGYLYRTNPPTLPMAIGFNSELMDGWQTVDTYLFDSYPSEDPTVGEVLYTVQPLVVEGELRGQFLIAHLSAGERQEVLVGLYVFGQVVTGLLALAFVLAWLGTGRLLRPVRDLATTARQITEADLTQRIEVQGSGELAALTTAFNAMMNRIQSAFDSQRSFINDAGHELRTPITIIRGHLELMGNDPAEQAETIDIVMNELDRMARLVNDLTLLMKSERADFLQVETIDIGAFTQALFDKACTLAERDWQLQIDPQVYAGGPLVADYQRLTGALLNLLNNAAQHTALDQRIVLGCRPQDDHVEFWVSDTGVGIAAADQARIFERFARAQHVRRRSEGAGLGLSLVRAIAEAHGGRITVVSQPGQGATFTLRLPRQQPPVTSPDPLTMRPREVAGV